MSLLLILVISICVSAGVLLLLSRELFRIIMGLAILGFAANLIVFIGGRPVTLLPAVMQASEVVLSPDASSPLPQALVLTAIVIGFALLCFALFLAAAVAQQHGHTDVAMYKDSEPETDIHGADDKPSRMEIDRCSS